MSAHSKGPCAVIDGHYPGFREITGYSFKISIVVLATDLTFEDGLKREADAQLIAAAPDLLAALQAAYDLIAEEVAGGEYTHQADQIRTAILKATGSAA